MSKAKKHMGVGLAAVAIFVTACKASTSTTGGAPAPSHRTSVLASANTLTFDNDRTLFVGDSKKGLVHAFALPETAFEDQNAYQLGRKETFEGRTIIDGLDHRLASLLGVTAKEIKINDMVVHKPTKQIFLAVHRGRGPDAAALILKVNRGRLEFVDLKAATYSSQSVGPVPAGDSLEFGQPLHTLAITDIDYYAGELFVAGISNEEFSSKLRRIPFPFRGAIETSSIEIWHAVHAQYETRAPIITQTIETIDGEPSLIAIYACTPIVRIPLDELVDGAVVRGEMIGEMGFGNTPIDIVSFVNPMNQTRNVLVTNTNRSAVQIPLDAIAVAETMPQGEGVPPNFTVDGVVQYPMPVSGALHLDTVDETWAVVVRRSPHDVKDIQLHTLPMPFFFDRSDHIVEMNWANGPDPFGYKGAPPIDFDD